MYSIFSAVCSPWDPDARAGIVELSGRPGRRRRADGAGIHDGRVSAGPPAGQDGDRQLWPQLFQRDPLHHSHVVR